MSSVSIPLRPRAGVAERFRDPRSLRFHPIVLLHGWHLLDLDAPAIAFAWTLLLTPLHTPHRALQAQALAVAVWLVYAGDRLLDAHGCPGELQPIHAFHRRHRISFRFGMVACSLLLLFLLSRISPPVCLLWFALATPLCGYALAVHRWQLKDALKNGLVCTFFALATAVPCWVAGHHAVAALHAVIFAALCVGNVVVIGRDASFRRVYLSRFHPGALLACLLGSAAVFWSFQVRRDVLLAAILAAVCLYVLDRFRQSMDSITRRALADVALLTPLVVLAIRA